VSNQLLGLLRSRREKLDAIAPSVETWSQVTEWHSGTRPIIAQHFGNQLEAFDEITKIRWTQLPRIVSLSGRGGGDNSRAQASERKSNSAKVENAHKRLASFIDALIELWDLDTGEADTQETDAVFAEIDRLIAESLIPQQFKTVVAADLADAQTAYRGGSYKGCVVMLGAALEGMMLGTLQRTDVLTHLVTATAPPGPIRSIGNKDPQLADKIGNELNFEDYKVCIHELIPGSAALGVENIQSFRNAIHPWKSIQEPLKYGSFDRSDALNFVGSLQKIVEAMYQWTPCSV